MKFILIAGTCLLLALPLASQSQANSGHPDSSPGLFTDNTILTIRLNGDIRALLDDRGDKPGYHPLTLYYRGPDSSDVSIPIQSKARGHFRKSRLNCSYPPLLLSFTDKKAAASGIFADQRKLKLVMPCKGDNFVIREWLVYRLYNLVSPESFRARLVSVIMNDTERKKQYSPFFGILLEEEGQMAARNHALLINRQLLRPEQTETRSFLNMAIFEYMIGNTDWSVQYLQNIRLLAADSNSTPRTVPYDFDHAGIVSAPYALPAEELRMSSVRERRYRGYCVRDMKVFEPSIALFNQLKDQFYSVYTGCEYLDPKFIKNTTQYLDAFYKTINDPKELKKEFGYPCDPNGTGNVVIRGLREDE